MTTPTLKILLVEDDRLWAEALQEMYGRILANFPEKVSITPCGDGNEAIKKFQNGAKFDLLSLDLNLSERSPDCSGEEVLRVAQEHDSCRGVVLISATDNKDLEKQISKGGRLQTIRVSPEAFLAEFGFNRNRARALQKRALEQLAWDASVPATADERKLREIAVNIDAFEKILTPATIRKIAFRELPPQPRYVFCPQGRDGKIWDVAFGHSEPVQVEGRDGFFMLELLLSSPGKEFSREELLFADSDPRALTDESKSQASDFITGEASERDSRKGGKESETLEARRREAAAALQTMRKERSDLFDELALRHSLKMPTKGKSYEKRLAELRSRDDVRWTESDTASLDRIEEITKILQSSSQGASREAAGLDVPGTLRLRLIRSCQRLAEKKGLFKEMAEHLGGPPPYRIGGAIIRGRVWYYARHLAKDWECGLDHRRDR